jgi:hypothetical protein
MGTTAQCVDENGVTFMFNNCVDIKPMNEYDTNKDGFEASDLNRWLQEEFRYCFPDNIQPYITDVSIPSYGMMFGRDNWFSYCVERDDDAPFLLTKNRKNRVSDFNGKGLCYWLKNVAMGSAMDFARVNKEGEAELSLPSELAGVRPIFRITTERKSDNEK